MNKAKRIPLGQLMGRDAAPSAKASRTPAAMNTRKSATRSRAATPARATAKSKPDVQKQLNVLIPQELHRKVKVKAMLEGKNLGALVEELLEEWAGER
jgi:hypothetical protein